MINKRTILSGVVCGALLIGGSVYLMKDESPQPVTGIQVAFHADRPKYTNMKDLVQASDLVFVGTVEGIAGTRNLARNPQDSTQEDPNMYVEGVDYNVKVIEILKGQADSDVLVTEDKQRRLGKDEPMILDEDYVAFTVGQSYIFFVDKSKTSGRYFAVGNPFFFAIENGKAIVKSNRKELLNIFKSEDVNLFKKAVKDSQ